MIPFPLPWFYLAFFPAIIAGVAVGSGAVALGIAYTGPWTVAAIRRYRHGRRSLSRLPILLLELGTAGLLTAVMAHEFG